MVPIRSLRGSIRIKSTPMNNTIPQLKLQLKQLKENLCHEFSCKRNISAITHKLVNGVDELLIELFHKHKLEQSNHLCLLAIGSYGRRELQLYSDIDLLILISPDTPPEQLNQAQLFLQDCWDIGLEISHQLTTVNDCAELASRDLSVISSVLDMHLLCGRASLMEELLYQTHTLHMWPSHDYFYAKQHEQNRRYKKYDETAYNLEPNVKYGPGGLRDIQLLLNIGKRHFGIKKLADGINCGFIKDKEYDELMYCQHFLWSVRFALHLLAQKKEERLLFDYQIKLAALFGYQDNPRSLAIEQFMKTYFNIIKRTRELNEMLLQWFSEAIIHQQKQRLTALDDAFQLSNNFIEVRHPKVFEQNPYALLQLFLWIATYPKIEGVRASTIRLLRQNIYLMTNQFLNSKAATTLFMAILKAQYNPYEALQRMSRYGVLSHYLECFSAVAGQMQYDLFHVYTVDQHTLFVIRNLTRFINKDYAAQFPLAHQLMIGLPKHEILYLAALFHDIAKGRGGDHSDLGAIEAEHFANRHHLALEETRLLVWLVKHHLLMSQTAQRQDIYDAKTIQVFCKLLPETDYLDYLYLLTVADICGTNPALWNAWKDSLLKELFFAAQKAMQQEKKLLDEAALAAERGQQALNILSQEGMQENSVMDLWAQFKRKYFLHETPEMIARHTKAILTCTSFPLVLIMPHHSQGGTEVFVYMPHRDERFTITTTVLSNHHATIQEAMILTTANHLDMDTYTIMNENHQAFFEEHRTLLMQQALRTQLSEQQQMPTVNRRRLSRAQAHFKLKPQISFTQDVEGLYTCLFLVTSDRASLLANIGRVLLTEGIYLHNAKIATAGERVEDMFYITNQQGRILSQQEEHSLHQRLILELS